MLGEGIKYVEANLDEVWIKALSRKLAKFANENPDCNFKVMSAEILGFLRNMAVTDGRIDESVEKEIERIEAIFKSGYKVSLKKNMQTGWGSIRRAVRKVFTRSNSTKNN